jgi:hypothetical protein
MLVDERRAAALQAAVTFMSGFKTDVLSSGMAMQLAAEFDEWIFTGEMPKMAITLKHEPPGAPAARPPYIDPITVPDGFDSSYLDGLTNARRPIKKGMGKK